MNILLTGGAGYIGSHTAVVLAKAGNRVVLYDNLYNSSASVVGRIKAIVSASTQMSGSNVAAVQFIKGDIRDTELLAHALKANAIDAVIHFAALKSVDESLAKPVEYYDNNIGGAISLFKAMRSCHIKTVVFSSSAAVYGNPQYLPLDENHPTSAVTPYGRSKLYIEEMLNDIAHADSTWRIACLRYFNPLGAHESGLIGEEPSGIPNNLMPYIGQVVSGRLSELKVFGNDYPTPDGTGVRDYIHVMDLAEGHVAAIRYLQFHPGWNVFNLGNGQGYSVLEVIKAFEAANGQHVPYRIVPRRASDVAQCYANPNKAIRELGWSARRSLTEMCASAWNFQGESSRKPR